MIHFDLPKEKSSIIKVIGVGGGGSNAVNHMFSQSIDGVNFIICNTDAQAIALSQVPNKIQLGPHLTQGLGAGANPEIGKQATEESLEEIKRILEVNTKMAFITAGMGGGTGTGGAPIISRICKELGILTVGIVTTPFSYEGRKRQIQAEEGIQQLKGYVDTLLVISNDKLRHQYGNLKMKEAFAKADNVLATAAKCITDVISSTGQINVDFADVCTVMRNGGVAILGNAAASGENRAQQAIEEALNSPLLNDNDIRGARWILININSAEGQHEFTMDEVDTIQSYLLSQAGEDSDVILGLGYDNTLEDKIGITLIATGFEYKDPFDRKTERKPEAKKEEKILMTLGARNEEAKIYDQPVLPFFQEEKRVVPQAPVVEKPSAMQPVLVEEQPESIVYFTDDSDRNITVDNLSDRNSIADLDSQSNFDSTTEERIELKIVETNSPVSAASGGYLAKPSNIYAEPASRPEINSKMEFATPPVNEPIPQQLPALPQKEDEPSFDMQLVIKDVSPAADQPGAPSTLPSYSDNNRTSPAEEPAMPDEAEEQKRKAAERIQKLRNLSFNINAADPNNEFDTVPAYIRRNLELYNTVSPAENFYSNYTVKTDEHNNSQISTINTFLDGKKPD
ncbi:cell division protein FtsZ [Flavihumibacter profundi]|uniref:cell division protein FtsZ n=1 Tax=Flavihumibacter profundi TaxID=2716883 RepID=UPI001CC38DED|nr:cell division protein FtsZ [Flavihumibacter profundi]MBZ5858239.1 cell division protein FtsZ [Flavihumibacter profundi]